MRCYEYFLSHVANDWMECDQVTPVQMHVKHGSMVTTMSSYSANVPPIIQHKIFSNCTKYFIDQLVNNFLYFTSNHYPLVCIKPLITGWPSRRTPPPTSNTLDSFFLFFFISRFFSSFPPARTDHRNGQKCSRMQL